MSWLMFMLCKIVKERISMCPKYSKILSYNFLYIVLTTYNYYLAK